MNPVIKKLKEQGHTVTVENTTYRCSANFDQIVAFSRALNADPAALFVIDGQSILPRKASTSSFQICDRKGDIVVAEAEEDWDSVYE